MRRSLASGLLAVSLASTAVSAQTPPNILLIFTDDQSTEQFDYMPFLRSIMGEGREFRRYYHTMPLCTPSRASMLTGMYPHNHGVVHNLPEHSGGYDVFMANGLPAKSWSRVLQDAGYQTAIVGKFMNGYPEGSTEVPDGWSSWWVIHSAQSFDYQATDNGVIRPYGTGDENYLTNVMRDRALAIIEGSAAAEQPFALLFAPICPHRPATPANAYLGTYADEPFPIADKPSFNEPDMSGKPSFVGAIPQMTPGEIDVAAGLWRRGLECNRSTDDAIAAMVQRLADLGQLDNTYIFITTDNGFQRGEHRLQKGKVVAYRESIQSSLWVFGPGVTPGIDKTHLVANIDFASTFAELAGAPAPQWADGRSMVPLFTGERTPWRRALLVRGIEEQSQPLHTQFNSYITKAYQYTLYHAANPMECEYYGRADVDQIDNLCASLPTAFIETANDRIAALLSCSGNACRAQEDRRAPAP